MNKYLKYLKKHLFQWIFIFIIIWCVFNLIELLSFMLIIPNKDYFLLKGISPISIIAATFGSFIVSAYVCVTVASMFGLEELIESLEELK